MNQMGIGSTKNKGFAWNQTLNYYEVLTLYQRLRSCKM